MKALFIHQNFPGQYLHLAGYLHKRGHEVTGLGEVEHIRRRGVISGISTIGYPTPQGAGEQTHHYLRSTEAAVRRGQAAARALMELRGNGYVPDVISVHPGWGEALFVRDVFPATPTLLFCEFFFQAGQADLGFDPEFPQSPDWSFSIRMRNSAQLVSLLDADAYLSPTRWQASRYPEFVRRKLHIIHDGVNSDYMTPDPETTLRVQPLDRPGESRLPDFPAPPSENGLPSLDEPAGEALTLGAKDKVVTFVARNLEPYRGLHVFLRALPALQKLHPDAQVIIVGHDGVSYSPVLPPGETYKARYLAEMKGQIDLSRVHFLGRISYAALRAVFRISSVHVYLTYPFVLSWSVLEAMACEALVLGSDTAPVREVISHGKNGLLVDFFDKDKLTGTMDAALREPERFKNMRRLARFFVAETFNLEKCLKAQSDLLEALALLRRRSA